MSERERTLRDISLKDVLLGVGILGGFAGFMTLLAVVTEPIQTERFRAYNREIDVLCGGPQRQNCITRIVLGCSGEGMYRTCLVGTEYLTMTPVPETTPTPKLVEDIR